MPVEALPEIVNGRASGLGSDIEQNAHVGLDEWTKRIEKPSVTVEFLLVLLLQTENDLNGAGAM